MSMSYFTDLLKEVVTVPQKDQEDVPFFLQTPLSGDTSCLPEKRSWSSITNSLDDLDQVVTESATIDTTNTTSASDICSSVLDSTSPFPRLVYTDPLSMLPRANSSQSGSQQTVQQSREYIMSAIEDTIMEIFDSLAIVKPVELQVLSRVLQRKPNNNMNMNTNTSCTVDGITDQEDCGLSYINEPRLKTLSLNNGSSALTFTRHLRVLEVIYEALANNIVMTKRDIFYRDIPLFKSQSVVNKIVDDLSCHYNVPRSCLNVSASGKGRIFGPANIILKSTRVLNCMSVVDKDVDEHADDNDSCSDELGTMIPPINQILDVECRAQVLIVIEKEASFRHLVSAGFVQRSLQRCLLITGCGYPDFATRHMVKHLSTRYPQMPILAVVDQDPYGLDIYSVYKWGSLAQAHDSVNLTIPSIRLLGLTYEDRITYGISSTAYAPLTIKDREKGVRMIKAAQQLQQSAANDHPDYKQFILELCKMIHLNQKCELQALCSASLLGFSEYLQYKLEAILDSVFL